MPLARNGAETYKQLDRAQSREVGCLSASYDDESLPDCHSTEQCAWRNQPRDPAARQ